MMRLPPRSTRPCTLVPCTTPCRSLGADANDARLVEVLQGLFADVRDVLRDLFLAELGVAGDALELLDVDRGEHVVLGDALGDEDRVLEIGRAHVCTPVTNANLVCRLLLENNNKSTKPPPPSA